MEEVWILNESLDTIGVLDDYYSLLWVERYDQHSDFILELPLYHIDNEVLDIGCFLVIENSDFVMRIDVLNPTFDSETGSKLVVEGKSAEYILNNRVPEESLFADDVDIQSLIQDLLDDTIISPTNPARQIDLMVFEHNNEILTKWTITDKFEDLTVYDIIKTIITPYGVGFSIKLQTIVGVRKLVFSLILGKDRSHNQSVLPRVIFSNDYDNVISADHYISKTSYKNVVLLLVEEEIPALQRTISYIEDEEPSGLARREVVVKHTINRTLDGGGTLTDLQVGEIISSKSNEELMSRTPISLFDGEFEIDGVFKYGTDFNLGDVVQCVINGLDTPARIAEHILSNSEAERKHYVSFSFDI
jgi:hypothetical protein